MDADDSRTFTFAYALHMHEPALTYGFNVSGLAQAVIGKIVIAGKDYVSVETDEAWVMIPHRKIESVVVMKGQKGAIHQ